MVAKKTTTKTTRTAKSSKKMSEPPARYGVLSEADADGTVWHYPVRLAPMAVTPAGAMAGESYPLIFFMGPVARSAQSAHGGHGVRAPRAAIRFRSRLRAVRFAQEDAQADRDVLQELKQQLA